MQQLFKTVILLMPVLAGSQLPAQPVYQNSYNSFHIYSRFTSFPDTGRKNGYTSEGKFYAFKTHYNDSSVLIITPENLRAEKKVDLVFWFHGWGNNIDSAAIRYELTKQFISSGRNAVLVLAETARNAPDSYAGKLNRPGDFKALVADVLNGLKAKKLIGGNCMAGSILLSGHSGAYGAIAAILKFGEVHVNEVILFDALYAKTEVFLSWVKTDSTHRFVHLYTDKGYGPLEESKRLTALLTANKLEFLKTEENALTPQIIQNNRLLFVHSSKEHNDIVNPDNFRLLILNEPFLQPVE